MSRILTVAKYLPAALSGLLVVAWVVSCFLVFGGADRIGTVFVNGSLRCVWYRESPNGVRWYANWYPDNHPHRQTATDHLGRAELELASDFGVLSLPIAFLLLLLLPFSIGPFIRFRFPLWSWFAFTALVAVELAYYLR